MPLRLSGASPRSWQVRVCTRKLAEELRKAWVSNIAPPRTLHAHCIHAAYCIHRTSPQQQLALVPDPNLAHVAMPRDGPPSPHRRQPLRDGAKARLLPARVALLLGLRWQEPGRAARGRPHPSAGAAPRPAARGPCDSIRSKETFRIYNSNLSCKYT